jgi:hypothetical protein
VSVSDTSATAPYVILAAAATTSEFVLWRGPRWWMWTYFMFVAMLSPDDKEARSLLLKEARALLADPKEQP